MIQKAVGLDGCQACHLDRVQANVRYQNDNQENMNQTKNQHQEHHSAGHSFPGRWLVMTLGLSVFLALPCSLTNAQWIEKADLKGPFVEGEPFDVLFLNQDADQAILKIKPLDKQLLPLDLTQRGQLIFEFFSGSEENFEVPFSSIDQIQTFDGLLVDEANQWIVEKEYAKAFRNLFYVYNRGGKSDPKMVASMMSCLYLDGKENFESGEFELALSIYEDIYERDPKFQVKGFDSPLVDIVMSCHNGMIKKRFENEDYVGVRKQLDAVVAKYGDTAERLKKEWTAKFLERSDELLARAKKFAEEGKGREAHLSAKKADQMSPGRPEILELQGQLLLQFPLIVVGVSQDGSDADPNRIEHWGCRRVGRLTQRTIVENTGLTDEGGKFEFLNGTIFPADDIGLKYVMEINENPPGFAVPPISAFELSMRLNSFADEKSPNYKVEWGKILYSVEIEDENRVSFMLRMPFVRPEALLKLPYTDPDENGHPDQNGFYLMTAEEGDIKTFEINPRYPLRPERQNPVIVEQVYSSASKAVDQLIAGNIDVVDRVPIADLERLKSAEGIKTRAYILPTVHMLVPKVRGEVDTDPNFRNGLSHAIDRRLLVNDVICGGKPIEGCTPISGPFPIGTEENDQIAYAYDMKVRPLAFNSQMGMVMVNLALRARPPVRPEPLPSPKLVIAHPQSSLASNASAAIARMWSEIGVETTTRVLKPGESIPPDEQWDFLYLEITMEEPLVDALNIIGSGGIAEEVSAPIEQTLRNLSYAQSWQSACAALRRLHRQTAIDLSIVPLWQVKEHFAYRNTVREIGRDLIHLYQNVDRWRIDLTAEEEQQEK